jgi:hypothetical protein
VLALAVLAFAGAAAGAGSARPTLTVRDFSPLTVRGTHFHSRELVTVTVVYRGRHDRRVRATAAGTFTVRFRFSVEECAKYVVSARGDAGSRAFYKRPPTMCPNPPAPVN